MGLYRAHELAARLVPVEQHADAAAQRLPLGEHGLRERRERPVAARLYSREYLEQAAGGQLAAARRMAVGLGSDEHEIQQALARLYRVGKGGGDRYDFLQPGLVAWSRKSIDYQGVALEVLVLVFLDDGLGGARER